MLVLGIESSCDETAIAVVANGNRVLSNAIASQIDLHARHGGVVPEIASRAHLEQVVPLLAEALSTAGVTLKEIDAIAATRGPGLAGCLLVGLEFAKGLSFRTGKPLVGIHHIAGHVYSPCLGRERDAWGNDVSGDSLPEFEPYLALVVSGGHSSLIRVHAWDQFETLGETMDDAVGEAYDKVAKLLGLGYPGGPRIDRLAHEGDPHAFNLPRPVLKEEHLHFSFSGLKTAVARHVEKERTRELSDHFVRDMCASFQAACIEVLLEKTARALARTGLTRLTIAGGVASNRGLRAAAGEKFAGLKLAIPANEYCTDNAAMIAGLGAHRLSAGDSDDLSLNALPSIALT